MNHIYVEYELLKFITSIQLACKPVNNELEKQGELTFKFLGVTLSKCFLIAPCSHIQSPIRVRSSFL